MTDVQAIQTMNPSKHIYLTVAGTGSKKHLKTTYKNCVGRFLMMLGFSSASMTKIAAYLLEKPDYFKNQPADLKLTLKTKMTSYAQKHPSHSVAKALQILNSPVSKDAQKQAAKLAQELDDVFKGNPSYTLGYYRNSQPVYKNMALALETYSRSGNLHEEIDPKQAHGMGSLHQPHTIGGTFKQALDPDVHGGMQQTIQAIKESAHHSMNCELDLTLADIGLRVVEFLSHLV